VYNVRAFVRPEKPGGAIYAMGSSTIAPLASVVRMASSYHLQANQISAADVAPIYRTEMD
jgi:hypothetical protein